MNYGAIKTNDIANGTGVRVSLFVSGCRKHCKECFQPETWDFCYGSRYTEEVRDGILEALEKPYCSGLTVLGGDPMEPENQREVSELLGLVKEKHPVLSTWLYTGDLFEDFLEGGRKHSKDAASILQNLDVMVDGPFILEQKNISLHYRGSENQRIIDVPASLLLGKAVCVNL